MNNLLAATGNKCWMLVDDNMVILALEAALMEKLADRSVACFQSPQQALAAFSSKPEKYPLVITDYEMPGMDGVELCRRMRAITPAQKIILATGSGFFTQLAARHAGFCGLLPKPFSIEALRMTLTEAELEPELLAPA